MSMMELFNRPPMHGPGCTCGCRDDCGPSWSQSAIDCYNQMSQFRNMLSQIMQDPCFQMPPIKGVTDGSNAKPGEVGEFVTGSATMNYAAYPSDTTSLISTLVIAPGDWDIWAWVETSTPVGAAAFSLSPLPAGMSNNMGGGGVPASVSGTEEWLVNIGKAARGSFTVPTLLSFSVTVHQAINAALLAGSATLNVEARRRR